MKQSIRALGWTINLSMLILFAFLASAVYSVFQTVVMEQGIRPGEFQTHLYNHTFVFSTPITANNTGYYDMTDFTMTTTLKNSNGTTLVTNDTYMEKIEKGAVKSRLHRLSLNLQDVTPNISSLLFHDTRFSIDFSVGFRYAYALSFHLTVKNTSIPWGAPLHGLTVKEVRLSVVNKTHLTLDVFLEFQNHSFFDVVGNLYLKIWNEDGEYIGSGTGSVNVPSNSTFSDVCTVKVEMENPLNYTGRGQVEVYFGLPAFDHRFKLESMSYG